MKKNLKLIGYETDLKLALNYLKLNKVLKHSSRINKDGHLHSAIVTLKIDKNSVIDLIKSRFGDFIKIKWMIKNKHI